ncbi:hypothetical protein SAMN04489858_108170 [Paracoccus homiensis]|uniref:Uncharacterized protein n=1 Tax=Paracoccus homiensis TaxID=364199 RepID=A0A1I0GLV5_9RHOB|nr:hypothetical protein SAMN04489858_108170 [Paracoccus homiensis]
MSKSRGNKIAEDAPFKRRPYRSVIPRLSCLRLAPSDRLVCLARLSGPFSVSRRSVKRCLRSAIRTRKQKNHPNRKKSCNALKTNKSSHHKIRQNLHPHHHTPHTAHRTHKAPNTPKTPPSPANADQTPKNPIPKMQNKQPESGKVGTESPESVTLRRSRPRRLPLAGPSGANDRRTGDTLARPVQPLSVRRVIWRRNDPHDGACLDGHRVRARGSPHSGQAHPGHKDNPACLAATAQTKNAAPMGPRSRCNICRS